MIDIRIPALEAFLYALCFVLVLFGLGYLSSLIDRTKGFTKEEAKKTEEQIRKMVGEVYGEVKDDAAHGFPQSGIQISPENTTTGNKE